jgi:hypothetical protein
MASSNTKISFELRKQTVHLSAGEVEKALRGIEPGTISKYKVEVGGRFYPPKQALAEAIRRPVGEFTTIDATRILERLGYEILEAAHEPESRMTTSESLFESYLNASGLTDFTFEPAQPNTPKRPDFCVNYRGAQILFEVKQFDQKSSDFDFVGGAYDPYRVVREKIESGRKKFKDLEDHCCVLVLYNNDKPLVELGWQFVYGAMLGNLGFSMPVNVETGVADESKTHRQFQGGGKMYRYSRKTGEEIQTQNTTISAIVVLRHYMVGSKRFEIAIKRKEFHMGRKLELEEFWEETQRVRGTALDLSLSQIRVVVHENPFARVPFPSELFRGPYDERYSGVNGRVERVFCGEQLMLLERDAAAADAVPAPENLESRLVKMEPAQLDLLCAKVAEHERASSGEADFARSLRRDLLSTTQTEVESSGDIQLGSGQRARLKRQVASFLSATTHLWMR